MVLTNLTNSFILHHHLYRFLMLFFGSSVILPIINPLPDDLYNLTLHFMAVARKPPDKAMKLLHTDIRVVVHASPSIIATCIDAYAGNWFTQWTTTSKHISPRHGNQRLRRGRFISVILLLSTLILCSIISPNIWPTPPKTEDKINLQAILNGDINLDEI